MQIYDYDQVKIPYDSSWDKIAISVSGGADSALLAYLICDIIVQTKADTEVHIISHIRMWKTRPWQQYDSLNVYNWLTDRFPSIKFCRHTNFIAPDVEYGNMGPTIKDEYNKMVSGDNAQQRAFAEFICYNNNISAYYNAVTRNPKGIDLGGMKERDIDKLESNSHLELMIHMGKIASHPFRFIDKSWIITQYKNKNIMDLFNITRSCEGEFADINFETYVPGQAVPICNTCFWCKEREWALCQD